MTKEIERLLNLCLSELERLYSGQPKANYNGNATVKAIRKYMRSKAK